MSYDDNQPLLVTREDARRLRQLLDQVIVGEGRIVVGQRGNQVVIGMRKTPVQAPVGDGVADLFRIKVQLDPSTASLTGSPTTQCGYKYFAYPPDEVDFTPEHRLPIGASSPSRVDYRGHMNLGPYDFAPSGSFGHAFMDGTNLRLFAWKEQPHSVACS